MNRLLNKLTPDYISDVLVRLAHHSSGLEGNTISLPETATIIIDQTLPNNSKITKREYFEVLNHETAFDYVIANVQNNVPLSISVVKDIHEQLTDRLQHDKGQFKTDVNYIRGVDFQTTPPEKVAGLMDQFVGNLAYRIESAETDEERTKAILEGHIAFEKIHPFSDGNGRTGRMIMNYSLLENDLSPLIIKKEDRNVYTEILHEAQTKDFPSKRDIEKFYDFAAPLMEEEQQRIKAFYNQAKQRIELEDDPQH
ncbi:Fic family protein [Gracilibacillus phocaeensis]|uniref:Fic family protein n=1 Tax=Gracilibacillus phocaeensis TaxID=2042304 RepID=UPI001030B50F|nr:Fic family protein [Gracilibacillus phocaeensis]